jgi:hypothetical protein
MVNALFDSWKLMLVSHGWVRLEVLSFPRSYLHAYTSEPATL